MGLMLKFFYMCLFRFNYSKNDEKMLPLTVMKIGACIRAFVATLVTVLLVVSCSKVERVKENNEIVMAPFSTQLTKAGLTPLGTDDDDAFGVFAYYADCEGETPWNSSNAWGAATEYFEDAAFAHNGVDWAGRDQAYYWPIEGSLMFAGYCPHVSVAKETVKAVSFNPNEKDINPYLQISFTQEKDALENMVDLLWFDVKDVADGKTLEKMSKPVSVNFKHALSKVSFIFTDSMKYYDLDAVALKGVVNEGVFYSGNTAGWMPNLARETLADYTLLSTAQTNTLLNGWQSCELYVIPQYLDGIFPTIGETLDSGVDVVLAFTVKDDFGSQEIEIPLKEYTERWEIGKSYQYTINAAADAIDFGVPHVSVLQQISAM